MTENAIHFFVLRKTISNICTCCSIPMASGLLQFDGEKEKENRQHNTFSEYM